MTWAWLAAVVLLLASVCPSAGAAAAAVRSPPDPHVYTRGRLPAASEPGLAQLRARAATAGAVRVFVQLDFPMTGEDSLSERFARAQSARLAAAQAALLSRAIGFPQSRHRLRSFRYVPFLALTANRTELERLLADPAVYWIGEVGKNRPNARYNIEYIRAPELWDAGFDGTGFAVAVLDTGAEASHPMLAGRIVAEQCYSTNDAAAGLSSTCPNGKEKQIGAGAGAYCKVQQAGCEHGTHVSGIAAGVPWNGLTGVGRGASLIVGNIFTQTDVHEIGAFDDDVLASLERIYSLRKTYKIAAVNLSIGGGSFSEGCDDAYPALAQIFRLLREAKIAPIVASGNDGEEGDGFVSKPACLTSAIPVGATDNRDELASFSNHSELVRVLAPGVNIMSAIPGATQDRYEGTSQAAPHVSGAFAILRDAKATASVDQILRALECTGVAVERSGIRKRRIDLWEAYQVLRSPQNEPRIFEFDKRADGKAWTDYENAGVLGSWRIVNGSYQAYDFGSSKAALASLDNCNLDLDVEFNVRFTAEYKFHALFVKAQLNDFGVAGYRIGLYQTAAGVSTPATTYFSVCRADYSYQCDVSFCSVAIEGGAEMFHQVKVKVRGERFDVFANGTKQCTFKDATYSTGAIILLPTGEAHDRADFERITITPQDKDLKTTPSVYGGSASPPRGGSIAARR